MKIEEKSGLEHQEVPQKNICHCYIGAKVVHIPEGVCSVEEISKIRNADYNEHDYYKLVPVQDQTMAVYIPVHSAEKLVRVMRSKDEIYKILDICEKYRPVWNNNETKRIARRNKAVHDDDGVTLAKLIKAYHHKRRKDHISIADSIWLKKAEQLLCSEIAEVLELDFDRAILKITE